jgi:hypothetical protein
LESLESLEAHALVAFAALHAVDVLEEAVHLLGHAAQDASAQAETLRCCAESDPKRDFCT